MSNRSHSQRAFARNFARVGTDLFPSPLDTASTATNLSTGRKHTLPESEDLAYYGITHSEFAAHHRVVTCALCQAQSRNVFLMLQFCKRTPGERSIILGARPQVKGSKPDGSPRVIWCIAPGLCTVCDDGHITRMDSITGEISCVYRHNERARLERSG